MPFCPQCRCEYVEGVAECSDCQRPLVRELEEEPEGRESGVGFVLLHTFPSLVYAEMVKEALENSRIPCLIKSDMLTSAYGLKGGGVGSRVRVYVPQDRVEESAEIMNQMLDHI